MIARYSQCHFATIMSSFDAETEVIQRCSFCGKSCNLVPQPHTLGHDLELTLRRWKDGDCTLDDMFARVNKELEWSYLEAFGAAKLTLQGNGLPEYVHNRTTGEWEKREEQDHE